MRDDFENVNKYEEIIKFLFINFNGNHIADEINKELLQFLQNGGEHVLNHLQRYVHR